MPTPKESQNEKAEISNADEPPSPVGRIQAAWARWEGAAARFKGLDIRLEARQELRYIFPTQCGYQVRIHRSGKTPFNRSVKGQSEESLHEAMRIRDWALQERPAKRLHPIPPKVLRALGLTSAVLGINRWAPRSVYRVSYTDPIGQTRLRHFYYRVVTEEDAYAAAIAFLQTTLK
ncbi:MAG: hypothetical protein H0X34_10395 [Chthoniobacterales bacterium]|jgi:hypothetical protein|nr:hypothetical protein [Chthoniobacterales bacterium]